MSESITLYDYRDPDIHVHVKARFDADKLIIDGYDIGKRVEEAMGDSDYEYIITVLPEHVPAVFNALEVSGSDRMELLSAMKLRFHDNYCFSNIETFLKNAGIPSERFSYR